MKAEAEAEATQIQQLSSSPETIISRAYNDSERAQCMSTHQRNLVGDFHVIIAKTSDADTVSL